MTSTKTEAGLAPSTLRESDSFHQTGCWNRATFMLPILNLVVKNCPTRQSGQLAMGQNPNRTPTEHPIQSNH